MNNSLTGFRAFTLIWFGQFISLVGSAMTRFAITIWVYQETGSATALALVGFFSFGPSVLFSPIAGAMVDRWNRKRVMMASDLIAGLGTVILFTLHSAGQLEVWHLYIAGFLSGAADSFQFPAYSAAITMMLKKEDYVRANGMLGLAQSASGTFAPIIGASFLAAVGLRGVMLIDIVTFVFAVGTLAMIHIPQPKITPETSEGRGSLLSESLYGFKYIYKRPSLLGMQLIFMGINFFATLAMVLVAALVLARTNNNEFSLGLVQAAMGIGGIAGGLFISFWGGPKRRVHGVLLGMIATGILGTVTIGLGRTVIIWMIGGFMESFFIPLLNGSNQAIWQAKVPAHLQGRIFAARRLIAQITAPVAMIIGGLLADHVFEPGMMEGGALADTFGWLVGTGVGSGMSLIFIMMGILSALVGLSGYLFPAVRNIETLLPDQNVEAEPIPEAQTATAEGDAIQPAPAIS